MSKSKKTEIPAEVIKEIQEDVKDLEYATVQIDIQDRKVVNTKVTKKRRW